MTFHHGPSRTATLPAAVAVHHRTPESELIRWTDALRAAVTAPGVLDLVGRGYEDCRRRLRAALRALVPGETLEIVSGPELTALRFEVEATMPQVYRWALPTGPRRRAVTRVERL